MSGQPLMTKRVSPEYNYTRVSNSTGAQIATGRVVLHYITVNATSAAAVAIIDGTSGNTANVGQLKASVVEGTYRYDATLGSGLRITSSNGTSHTGDLTVVWSQG